MDTSKFLGLQSFTANSLMFLGFILLSPDLVPQRMSLTSDDDFKVRFSPKESPLPHLFLSPYYHVLSAKHFSMKRKVPSRLFKLTDLPPELVLCVCDFLSPAQMTCLALCNHDLMDLVSPSGSRVLDNRFPAGRPGDMTCERSRFLTTLSGDLPQYYFCCTCSRLHLWRNVNPPGPSHHFDQQGKPDKCSSELADSYSWLRNSFRFKSYACFTYYAFHYVHLHLMMRWFHYGPDYGLSPDTAFHTEITWLSLPDLGGSHITPLSPVSSDERFSQGVLRHILSVEARVCPASPSLGLRIQSICLVPRYFALMLIPKRNFVSLSPCIHLEADANSMILHLFKSHIEAYCANQPLDASGGNCKICNTSYEFQVEAVGTQHATLTITRWVDLGPGLTPEDIRWRSHLLFQQRTLGPSSLFSDPRRRFEQSPANHDGGDQVSFKQRYRRNLAWLREGRHLRMMSWVGGSSRATNRDVDFGDGDTT